MTDLTEIAVDELHCDCVRSNHQVLSSRVPNHLGCEGLPSVAAANITKNLCQTAVILF